MLMKIQAEEREDRSSPMRDFEISLHKRVIGQDAAVRTMASALLKCNGKENRTFLFVGPTGVGKRELAEAVGAIKGPGLFLRFDMTNYQTAYQVANFTGTGSGLVGSCDLPEFCKTLNKSKGMQELEGHEYVIRDTVILFDGLGKTHPTVRSGLLTLFDRGTHTAHFTEKCGPFDPGKNVSVLYRFESCIFIGTSNLFQEDIIEALAGGASLETIVKKFTEASSRASLGCPIPGMEIPFSPGCLSRMAVIPFTPIPRGPDGFQAVVGLRLTHWIETLNKYLQERSPQNYGRVVIKSENRADLLKTIEEGLYGRGTDLRKIVLFFDKIHAKLLSTSLLKATSGIELSMYGHGREICVQRFIVDDLYLVCRSYQDPIKLFSFEPEHDCSEAPQDSSTLIRQRSPEHCHRAFS